MNLRQELAATEASNPAGAHWRAPLWRWASWVVTVALLLWPSTSSMVGIWWNSGTFNHALGLPPLLVWLVWRRRQAWLPLVPQADARWWWALLPLALLAALNEAAMSNAPGHLALVLLWVLSVPALLGTAVARQWSFALGYALFMVPVGDFLLPSMMEWTATFTVWAVRLSGVPVYREGLDFVIPSGSWSVVEACSGVRYLIASLCVGVLYAHLTYRTWRKRLVFVAAALVVPTVANWLRAYGIVMLGHWSDNTLATGLDHLVYGWVFFGLVLGLLFWGGSRWADGDTAAEHVAQRPTLLAQADAPLLAVWKPWWITLALVAAPMAAWHILQLRTPGVESTPWPAAISAQAQTSAEFACPVRDSAAEFRERRRIERVPASAPGGDAGAVWVEQTLTQHQAREHRAPLGDDWGPGEDAGLKRVRGRAPQPLNASAVGPVPAQLWQDAAATSLPLSQSEAVQRWLVVRWLRVDGRWMAPGGSARAALVQARLRGRPDAVEAWVACTPVASDADLPVARERLQWMMDAWMKDGRP